jgi:hypothetical protein
VTGELLSIEPRLRWPALDDRADRVRREPDPHPPATPADPPEQRTALDLRRLEPAPEPLSRRRSVRTLQDEDLTLRLGVGLRAPDPELDAVGLDPDVFDPQRRELGSTEGARKSEAEDRSIAQAPAIAVDPLEDLVQPVPGDRRLALCDHPFVRRISLFSERTSSLRVGSGAPTSTWVALSAAR